MLLMRHLQGDIVEAALNGRMEPAKASRLVYVLRKSSAPSRARRCSGSKSGWPNCIPQQGSRMERSTINRITRGIEAVATQLLKRPTRGIWAEPG
jgi:hypothetical protein